MGDQKLRAWDKFVLALIVAVLFVSISRACGIPNLEALIVWIHGW